MSLSAINARNVSSPTIPYNTIRYSLQIATSINRTSGALQASGILTVYRCRQIPAVAPATAPTWEDDPSFQPVSRPIADVFALAGQMPEVAAAMTALNAAVAAYNAANHLA